MDSNDTKGTKDKRAVVFIDGNNFYHGMRHPQPRHFESVSVRLPPRFFLRRLTDTYDLGNLHKSTVNFNKTPAPKDQKNGGLLAARFARFVQVRANLREIARIIPDTRPAGYAKIRSRRIFPEVVSARKPLCGNGR